MRTRFLVIALVIVGVSFGSLLVHAQVDSENPSLTHAQWCRYMDELQRQRNLLYLRMGIDTAVALIGTGLFFKEAQKPVLNVTRMVFASALWLAGTIDLFLFTFPRLGSVQSELLLFKVSGGARMWVWPCSGASPQW